MKSGILLYLVLLISVITIYIANIFILKCKLWHSCINPAWTSRESVEVGRLHVTLISITALHVRYLCIYLLYCSLFILYMTHWGYANANARILGSNYRGRNILSIRSLVITFCHCNDVLCTFLLIWIIEMIVIATTNNAMAISDATILLCAKNLLWFIRIYEFNTFYSNCEYKK